MKAKIYITALGLLFMAVFFLLKEPDPKKKIKKHNNTAHIQNILTPSETKKQKSKKPKSDRTTQNNTADVAIKDTIEVQQEKDKNPNIDYISAYRDYHYFANCYTDVEDFLNKKDPLETLSERFENNPRESQDQPTALQNTYYQHHVEICKSMIDDEEDDYYAVREKLLKRFDQITPKTEEEKQLETALQLVDQLQQLKRGQAKSFVGQPSLPSDQLDMIYEEIKLLSDEIMQIYNSNEELSEEMTLEIRELSDRISELKQIIVASQQPDKEEILQAMNAINQHINEMDRFLQNVLSPDAFLVIAENIFQNEYFMRDSDVLGRVKQATGMNDSYYINVLNKIVFPLVACSMNYPCDSESDYILSYCLGLKDSMFNQACGSSLEDFYFNFYIGPNQLNDVNNYFLYLVNRYAN